MNKRNFDINCQHCPRLSGFLKTVREEHPDYYARPVPAFGDPNPELLIVGLAPGYHGANASGRPFTGDYAGILLYQTLHKFGYASHAESVSVDDGLILTGCRITNAVKCLPPENKPTTTEIRLCNEYLANELESLPKGNIVLALGGIAHNAVLRAFGLTLSRFKFAHNALHDLGNIRLVDSYHCSRYNTQTRRLTTKMFEQVFEQIRELSLQLPVAKSA